MLSDILKKDEIISRYNYYIGGRCQRVMKKLKRKFYIDVDNQKITMETLTNLYLMKFY